MKHIHFMGVGGVGMAGLAFLLRKTGYTVTGCDCSSSARTAWLETNGVEVEVGHSPLHLDGVDEVVVTPAVHSEEAELVEAKRRGIPVRFRGEALADIFNRSFGVAVCGTHGKTTTSTFIAKLLRALGDDPSWCIGGETGEFPVAGKGADAAPFVVEADESDGTLALYTPKILVVMNMDWDHPDHFPTEASYRACFETAMAHSSKTVLAEQLDVDDFPEIHKLVNGAHNAVNARAAIEVAMILGHSREEIVPCLAEVFSALPDRRFQCVYDGDVKLVTDYAHHPRELTCAISMARSLSPKRLRVIFQPHRYSRTKALLEQFPPSVDSADEVVLVPVYSAFEDPVEGGDIADLYRVFRERGVVRVFLARSAHEAWRHMFLTRENGDLVLVAGAGDVVKVLDEAVDELKGVAKPVAPRRIWAGAFTNTWRSDLAVDEEYVRTQGPASRTGSLLGIPWMAGIPGTIGGWLKMNAGAFGHSISEVVKRVNLDGRWLERDECGFGYRTSALDGEIRDAEFSLPEKWNSTAEDFLAMRLRFPAGTKGSVFKNPQGDFAGRLLEEAGVKGMRVGGAYVWEEHANVIVAGDGATASDFLALARLMARKVLFHSGVRLEPEVKGLAIFP